MKKLVLRLVGVMLALMVIGLLVVVSGIVPIKASSGHWAVTRWFLDFAKSRSISLHSRGIDVPPLDDPGLAVRGAAHYETGCRPCHGAPGRPRSEVAAAMTPIPPDLSSAAEEFREQELFYIVKHGIKMTGMPAWPAQQRDDEVWAVVAFLRALPGMSPGRYRELAFGDIEPSPPSGELDLSSTAAGTVAENCARCHAADAGRRTLASFPDLAQQHEAYLAAALRAYKAGRRHSGIMEPVAGALDEDTIDAIARALARSGEAAAVSGAGTESISGIPIAAMIGHETEAPPEGPPSPERGAEIARRGIPERKVPACAACHGPVNRRLNRRFPVLVGQDAAYLFNQLVLFKNHRRGGTDYDGLMAPVVRNLDLAAMRDVAAWYASLAPAADAPVPQR